MSEKEKIDNLETMRHSAAHILARAVLEVFPETKLGIGPAIADGFYYDFKLPVQLSDKDLPKIEDRMRQIIKKDEKFEKEELSKEEALKLFRKLKEPFKVELIEELKDEKITIYKNGDFVDLCKGPHLKSTGGIGPFKLTSIAGAYWRGSEQNPQLQRVYGTCFKSQKALDKYLERLEKAAKRDHRKIGKDLELYSISEEIGPGLILWHQKGAIIRKIIEDFWHSEHLKRGYELVYSPHIAREIIWKKSGHLDNFSENMFSPFGVEGDDYLIKPMNCPFHIEIYKSRLHSYKELPIRLAELGTVYRYEKSGVLHGLTRVRGFTQDDAHIFCTEDQIEKEVIGVLDLARFMLKKFGFKKYNIYLSTKPEKYVGSDKIWERAEEDLKRALEKKEIKYEVDKGGGAFYGPKIDIKLEDAFGREWQGPTIQLDFAEPDKFDVEFIGEDGKSHRAIMIHRTVLGAMERFFGCLIEHYAGAFPFWLAPVQVKIITISDKQIKYAEELAQKFEHESIRFELDLRNETLGKKIREGELEKVPYFLIIGNKEMNSAKVAVRSRKKGDLGAMNIDDFIKKATEKNL